MPFVFPQGSTDMVRMNRGFTLIEALVVIAIIAILATLAMPSRVAENGRKQVEESLALLDTLKPVVERFYYEHAELPLDNAEAGLPGPDKLPGNFVSAIELEQGAFHLHFGNKAIPALQGKQLSVRAVMVPDSPMSPLSWVCGDSAIPDGMTAPAPNRTSEMVPGVLPIECRDLSAKEASGSK